MKLVKSRDNPEFRKLLKLSSSSRERRASSMTILEGEHIVEAYRASGAVAEALIAGESAFQAPRLRALFERTPAKTRLLISDRLVSQLSQVATAAGLFAVIRTSVSEAAPEPRENCLLLESIQDPGNVGSIFRSAVAAGVRRIFLSPGSVFAWAPKVVRAGQGAHFLLSIGEKAPLVDVSRAFQGKVVATDPHASTDLYHADLSGPVAWLFGNEGSGLSAELAAAATLRVRIPMPGPAESLNVAAAAAICLFEQVRQNVARRPPAPAIASS